MESKLRTTALVAVLMLGAAAARAADAPPPRLFPGRIEAAEQTGISVRVAGTVNKINVDVGDRVKKGQVLIELDAPELKDELDAAAARREQAKAEVDQAEAATQAAKARVAQADAAVEAAKAAVKRAKAASDQAADAYRASTSVSGHILSVEELEKTVLLAAAARDAATEAEAQLKIAELARDVAVAEVARAEAGVKAAQAGVGIASAGVQRAQTQLGYTKATAPYDGVVTRRLIDTGAVVGPPIPGETAPLLTVMRDDVVHVVFDVDERSASLVAVGAPAAIRGPALGDAVFAGKVTRMAGAFNPDTGTLRVEIDLANSDGKLRPGTFVNIELKKAEAGK